MDHISCADWRSFAGANIPVTPIDGITDDLLDLNFGLQGANYIQDVALAMYEKLPPLAAFQINIGAHSWGTLVGHDLAGYVIAHTGQKVNSFISLDTAGNNKFPLGSNYPIDSVDFRNVANTSWAFEGSAFGSNERSARANMTFRIDVPHINPTEAHRQVVEVFSDMIEDQTNDKNAPVSHHFLLEKLLSHETTFPWQADGKGILVPDGYEGIITTIWNGKFDPSGQKLYEADYLKYTDPQTGKAMDHQK